MIYVTGDTHGIIDAYKLYKGQFPLQKDLTKEDYLIIAGDFGGVWDNGVSDKKVQAFHNEKKYTTLFVAGNHENHRLLQTYPIEDWNGGKIHRISENIIHLINGEVYSLEDKKIFVMGGATSLDVEFRTEGVSWWPEEEPSIEDYERAINNLSANNDEVDYIITHTCPESVRRNDIELYPGFVDYESGVEKFLDDVLKNINYKIWYLGHLHIDRSISEKNIRFLYNDIVELGKTDRVCSAKE